MYVHINAEVMEDPEEEFQHCSSDEEVDNDSESMM